MANIPLYYHFGCFDGVFSRRSGGFSVKQHISQSGRAKTAHGCIDVRTNRQAANSTMRNNSFGKVENWCPRSGVRTFRCSHDHILRALWYESRWHDGQANAIISNGAWFGAVRCEKVLARVANVRMYEYARIAICPFICSLARMANYAIVGGKCRVDWMRSGKRQSRK